MADVDVMCCKSVGTDLSMMDIDDLITETCQLKKMVSSLEKKLIQRDKLKEERSADTQDNTDEESLCDRHGSTDQTSSTGEQTMMMMKKMKMCSVKLVDCKKMMKENKQSDADDDDSKLSDAQRRKARKSASCQQCGKFFIHTGALNRHMRIHTGERPFTCLQCGKSFTRSCVLKNHQRIHSGSRPFTCDQCEKRFTSSSNLKSHLGIHFKKKYDCSFCGKSLSRIDHFRNHQKIHSVVEAHMCFECGKTFITAGTLKKHQKIHAREKP